MSGNWKEQLSSVRDGMSDASPERARILDMEKESGIPIITKEPSSRPFDQVRPQPVIGDKTFEGEFFVKGKDVIFHFWPFGYHKADDLNKIPPRFNKKIESVLKSCFEKNIIRYKVEISEDRDMGAWFVKIVNGSENLFYYDNAIAVCESIHEALGGSK